MADMLKFKLGLYDDLTLEKVPVAPGTVYVTADEKAMYVDVPAIVKDGQEKVAASRIRIGDFIRVSSVENIVPPFSTSSLYYVEADNALLKYDGSAWKQVNGTDGLREAVAAIEEDIKGINQTLEDHDSDIEALKAAVGMNEDGEVEGLAGTVGQLRTDLNALSEDVTELSGSVDTRFESVNNAVADKVATETFNATVEELEGEIAAAEGRAATDAQSKANAAESAAKSHADSEIAKAKTALEGQINGKVSQDAFDATVGTLETKVDASAKLTEAKGYTDQEIGKLDTKIGNNAKAISDEANRADQAEKALGLRIDGVNTQIEGINTTVSGLATKTELANQKTDLEGQIATAKSDAISDAKDYTDDEIVKVNAEVAKKADAESVNSQIGNITKADTGLIAVAKKEAIETAASDATGKANKALEDANKYTDAEIDKVEVEVAKKATTEALNTSVSTLEGKITAAQSAAESKAAELANAAKTGAEATAASALATAKTELTTEINKKADKTALEQAITNLEKYADDAKAAANTYTDKKVAKALAEADAMTFRGTVSLSKVLPTTGVQRGDTYKVAEKGEYAGVTCFVGDLLIAAADQGEEATYTGGWEHVSSGYEDDYDPALSVDGNKVFLRNTVGTERGSVTFVAKDESVNVSVAGEADPATGVANTTVTIGIEWGTF